MEREHLTFVEFLTYLGASASIQPYAGNAAVHPVAQNDNFHVLRKLIPAKADLNFQNIAGRAVLMIAAVANREDVVNRVLAEKVDLDTRDSYGNATFCPCKRTGQQTGGKTSFATKDEA